MARDQRTAAELRESEGQLRFIADNAPVSIVHIGRGLRYKFINKHHAEWLNFFFGVTPAQAIGKRVSEVLGKQIFATLKPHVRSCLRGESVSFEVEAASRTGEPQSMLFRLAPEEEG